MTELRDSISRVLPLRNTFAKFADTAQIDTQISYPLRKIVQPAEAAQFFNPVGIRQISRVKGKVHVLGHTSLEGK